MRIFHDLKIVEQPGSGIPRILQVNKMDVFYISQNFMRLVLPYADGL